MKKLLIVKLLEKYWEFTLILRTFVGKSEKKEKIIKKVKFAC
jgi:hypothetical protein